MDLGFSRHGSRLYRHPPLQTPTCLYDGSTGTLQLHGVEHDMESNPVQWLARLDAIPALVLLAGVLAALVSGWLIGSAQSRKTTRRLQRDLDRQRLENLDLSAELISIERHEERSKRQQRLIRLVLRKLKRAERTAADLSDASQVQQRQHHLHISRLKLDLAEARERGRAAAALARRATTRVKRLEGLTSRPAVLTQHERLAGKHAGRRHGSAPVRTDQTTEPKRRSAPIEPLVRGMSQDTTRLGSLPAGSTLERTGTDNLQAIHGIDPRVEKSLNAAGIHRVEQLASLTESELAQLRDSVGVDDSREHGGDWIGGARRLIRDKSQAQLR